MIILTILLFRRIKYVRKCLDNQVNEIRSQTICSNLLERKKQSANLLNCSPKNFRLCGLLTINKLKTVKYLVLSFNLIPFSVKLIIKIDGSNFVLKIY